MNGIGIFTKRALWIGLVVLLIPGGILALVGFAYRAYRQSSEPALDPIVSTVTSASITAVDLATTAPTDNLAEGFETPSPTANLSVSLATSTAVYQQIESTARVDKTWQMIGQVNKDRALADLRQLSGDVPICTKSGCYTITNRLDGSVGLHWAKDYIYQELVNFGYSPEIQDWSRSRYSDQNIVTRKQGISSPNEEIYFVAHIDGVKPAGKGLFPAADDNASGVVDLLEVARVLSSYSFNRTIVFLFTTGEEQGTSGVRSYIDQLSQGELSSIKYVINVDMVGYNADNDGGIELWYGGHPPSFALAQTLDETIKAYQLKLVPRFVVGCG